jgi:hypothetical protein
MKVGFSKDRTDESPGQVAEFILREHSAYEIVNPLTWHSVVPLTTTYTVMLNAAPFPPDVAHTSIRRTGGKDLDKMPEDELVDHLQVFANLVGKFQLTVCSACDGSGVGSPAHPWGSPKCGECNGTGERL